MPSLPPARWAAIRLFATDVDGVLTDGGLHIHSDGTESKVFSVLDGGAMHRLREAGIAVAWISGRASTATTVRATELRVEHLIQGRNDKAAALQQLAAQLEVPAEACLYVGDDDIDVGALRWAGIGAAPADAMPVALAAADYITARPGGRGVIRELSELILAARGQDLP